MKSIDRAREFLGVPFLHLGRNMHAVDCIGLVAYSQGWDMETIPTYPRDPYQNELERNLHEKIGAPVLEYGNEGATLEELRAGDILALAYAKHIRHIGLVATHPTLPDQLSIIHTDAMLGKVVEHILDTKWLRRIRKVYRP